MLVDADLSPDLSLSYTFCIYMCIMILNSYYIKAHQFKKNTEKYSKNFPLENTKYLPKRDSGKK